jgi:hypothetical protein
MLGKAGNRTGSKCVSDDRQKSALILCIAQAIHARSAARGITATGAARLQSTKSDRTRLMGGVRAAAEICEKKPASKCSAYCAWLQEGRKLVRCGAFNVIDHDDRDLPTFGLELESCLLHERGKQVGTGISAWIGELRADRVR